MNITLPPLIFLILALLPQTGITGAFDDNSLVWKKCTICHSAQSGKIARVEAMRTTPEEWTVIVDRMRRLHGMRIRDGEMAILLKELCSTQILSPEEQERVAYLNLFNNPQTVEAPNDAEEEQLFATCVRCHSVGKIYSYRMTEPAWQKLRDFHLYMDPAIMYQMREMHWRSEADKALQGLAQKLPYDRGWQAPDAKPDGEWFLLGVEPGKGNYRGKASLRPKGDDEYVLQGVLNYSDGTFESFTGEATLYGGYALRTRARQNGSATMGAFSFLDGTIVGEHHHHAPHFRTSSSKWFASTFGGRPLRMTPGFLLAGEKTKVLLEGFGFPEVTVKDIVVSSADVKVLQAITSSPETIELVLTYGGTGHGTADVSLRGRNNASPKLVLSLAPGVDYLKVTPPTGRARVSGGQNYPAEGVQFQALAYSSGADLDDPLDDYLLGPVAANFSLVEEKTRPGDDDLEHLGTISKAGTYLPSGDYNPIPSRDFGTEGTGLVKVVAVYVGGGSTHTAEGKLVVTVPDYIQRLK